MTRTLRIRVNKKSVITEYKRKMNETKIFYNACLFVTRYRHFLNSKNSDQIPEEVKEGFKSYHLDEWLQDENVWLGQMASYGNDFLIKIQEKTKVSLTRKEQQTILRKICADWTSFFRGFAEAKQSKRKINIPYYKDFDYATSEFNKQMVSLVNYDKDKEIKLTGTNAKVKMPDWLKKEEIQSARLKYTNGFAYLEVIYNKAEQKKKRLSKKKVASIDPGLNWVATLTFNWMKKPIGIRGKELKSINQLYNKERSKISSAIDTEKDEKIKEKLIKERNRITEKRNLRIEHQLHKISNYIVNTLVENKVSKLIFGHNNGQKENINIGKRNNQNFVSIPFAKLIQLLDYKCEEAGIEFIVQEESYTSKASFLSSDFMPVKNNEPENFDYKFSGYRPERGKYKDKKVQLIIHSDCNGSYNIMRKNGINLEKVRKTFIKHNNIIELYGITIK